MYHIDYVMCLRIRSLGAIPDQTQQGVVITSVGEDIMENVHQRRDWALSCTFDVLCDGLNHPTIFLIWNLHDS